ncbi:MAG: aminoacyl-tRNA deacylase [Vicinamibacterales bacterium]
MAIPTQIADFLKSKPYTTLSHRTAFTAQEEAAVTHVPGRAWAKTVVCYLDGRPAVAVVPAYYRVDLERLRLLAGAKEARLATEAEVAGLYPGIETGAVPPLGPLYGQAVYVDRTIAADEEVAFHAGTHTDAVRMRYEDLADLSHPVIGEFGIGPAMAAHHGR